MITNVSVSVWLFFLQLNNFAKTDLGKNLHEHLSNLVKYKSF